MHVANKTSPVAENDNLIVPQFTKDQHIFILLLLSQTYVKKSGYRTLY